MKNSVKGTRAAWGKRFLSGQVGAGGFRKCFAASSSSINTHANASTLHIATLILLHCIILSVCGQLQSGSCAESAISLLAWKFCEVDCRYELNFLMWWLVSGVGVIVVVGVMELGFEFLVGRVEIFVVSFVLMVG